MLLKKLRLINFKNYRETAYSPEKGINCILGKNGSGKTNLLDAIHYLSMTKSAFNSADYQNIQTGASFFSIIGHMEINGEEHHIRCSLESGKKKVLEVDENEYEKLSEHIGRFPTILVAPHQHGIIQESHEVRRRFFDGIISQIDRDYLETLLAYNHNLKQRNGVLRFFRDTMKVDSDLIAAYDDALFKLGIKIYKKRKSFLASFQPVFQESQQIISGKNESCQIAYYSQFDMDDDPTGVKKYLERELELQRSLFGTHRDKWNFTINDQELKKFGSQGQQKTFILALQLAQFDLLLNEKGFSPVLLLDDIFDRLDDDRIQKFMELVGTNAYEQIFITDARFERTTSILSSLNLDANFVRISEGNLIAFG